MAPRTARAFTHTRDYAAIGEKWAKDVVAGKIVACKWVKLACKRHLNDLQRARTDPNWGFQFDRWHADDVCDFIEKLPHVEGVWETPTITLEPAQVFILTTIFGWRRKADRGRRFSYVYIEMARKAAKSTLTAGVTLYCLTCEDEVGPQVVIGATTGPQAKMVFNPAKKMVEKSAALREAFDLSAWANAVTCAQNDGTIKTINAKGSTQDGHNPHLGVLDELHAHANRGLFDVIKSAFGARKNPLMWIITTAGFNTTTVCYEQRTYLTKVLEGIFEADHYFGIVFNRHYGQEVYDTIEQGDRTPTREVLAVVDEYQTKRVYVVRTSALAKWSGGAADVSELRRALLERGIAIPYVTAKSAGPIWDYWPKPIGRNSCLVLRAEYVDGDAGLKKDAA